MTTAHLIETLKGLSRGSGSRRSRRRTGFRAAVDRLEGRALLSYVPDWGVDLGVLVEYTRFQGSSVAVDSAGNFYMIGSLSGAGDFDPNAAPADGSDVLASRTMVVDNYTVHDAVVAKYAPDGHLLWVRGFGGDGDDQGLDIVLDGSGHVYITGTFSGTGGFGSDAGGSPLTLTSAGGGDVFIAKLDAAGYTVWARSMGSSGNDSRFNPRGGIAVDGAGNVFTCGSFAGTADFDQTAAHAGNSDLLTSAGGDDVFITKHAPDGSLAWARRIGNGQIDLAGGLAVDPAGNVLLTGQFREKVDFDPGPGSATLSSTKFDASGFVLKLNGAGGYVWAKKVGWSASDVATDGSGNVFVTGAGTTGGTGYVAKYSPAGGSTWAKTFDVDTSGFGGMSIAVDGAGNSYVTGSFSRTVDLDPGRGTYYLTAQGRTDAFVLVLDTGGNFVAAASLSGTELWEDYAYGIAVDDAGDVYVVGKFSEPGRMILRKLKKV